jgi:hypothetical protein
LDQIRSNDERRAVVILAGKEIKKLNFGKTDTPPAAEDAAGAARSEGGYPGFQGLIPTGIEEVTVFRLGLWQKMTASLRPRQKSHPPQD